MKRLLFALFAFPAFCMAGIIDTDNPVPIGSISSDTMVYLADDPGRTVALYRDGDSLRRETYEGYTFSGQPHPYIREGYITNLENLVEIYVGTNIWKVAYDSFKDAPLLRKVSFHDVHEVLLEPRCFYGCTNLSEFTFPKMPGRGVGMYAFYGCKSLTYVKIPNGVEKLSDYMFSCCNSMYQVEIPHSVTEIGKNAFEGCGSLQEVTLPMSVTNVQEYAFSACGNLRRINMPSVSIIGRGAFMLCHALVDLELPSSLRTIGKDAFAYCYALERVVFWPWQYGTFQPYLDFPTNGIVFSEAYELRELNFGDSVSRMPNLPVTCKLLPNSLSHPDEFRIVVPDGLYDTCLADESWSRYAEYIRRYSDCIPASRGELTTSKVSTSVYRNNKLVRVSLDKKVGIYAFSADSASTGASITVSRNGLPLKDDEVYSFLLRVTLPTSGASISYPAGNWKRKPAVPSVANEIVEIRGTLYPDGTMEFDTEWQGVLMQ